MIESMFRGLSVLLCLSRGSLRVFGCRRSSGRSAHITGRMMRACIRTYVLIVMQSGRRVNWWGGEGLLVRLVGDGEQGTGQCPARQLRRRPAGSHPNRYKTGRGIVGAYEEKIV